MQANLFICYSIPILTSIPYYISVECVKASNSTTETDGYWKLTDLGHTLFIRLFTVAVLFLEGLIPTILLIILNTISLIQFKRVLSRVTQTPFIRSVEINLVRMVLILTLICIISRSLEILTEFFARGVFVLKVKLSREAESVRVVLKQIAFLCIFGAHALDGLVYYYYDRHLKQVARKIIRQPYNISQKIYHELFFTYY